MLAGKNEEIYQKSGWILEMCVTSEVKNEISAKNKIYRIDIIVRYNIIDSYFTT